MIAHDPGDDFVLNYGELTKAFKINPNIKDSFAKTANKHKEIGDNRKVTEVKNHFLKQRSAMGFQKSGTAIEIGIGFSKN